MTDSHRLSYYHVLGAPAGAVYIPFLRLFQYLFRIPFLPDSTGLSFKMKFNGISVDVWCNQDTKAYRGRRKNIDYKLPVL